LLLLLAPSKFFSRFSHLQTLYTPLISPQDQEKTDVFLIQDSTDRGFAGLLTDGSVSAGISAFFTSTGPPPVYTTNSTTSPLRSQPQQQQAVVPVPAPAPIPAPAPALAPAPAPAVAVAAAPVAPPVASATPPAANSPFAVIIIKGEHGIGLDIGRTADSGCVIQRLKDMPPGVVNPASRCVPALVPGDLIIGVNGTKMVGFNDIVKAIRSSGEEVKLLVSRP
jgi:hypothetical protein